MLAVPFALTAQELHSWDGYSLPSNTKGRVLNLFINVIYDVHPDWDPCQSTEFWPTATREGINNDAIPSYLLDFMDTVYRPGQLHGTMTRLYGEASFDSLQLTGDFVVVNVLESRLCKNGRFFGYNSIIKAAINMINEQGGLTTLYGHNRVSDYLRNGKYLYNVQIILRNTTKEHNGVGPGCGFGNSATSTPLLIDGEPYLFSKSTIQCVGDQNFAINPTNIVSHEISHLLFGSNDFHTSGGNHRAHGCSMSFLNIQGGYGLMGAANSGLVCCNGYERWRMHWKHPEAADYISAYDVADTHSVPSDIRREDGNISFRLRDFLTYGDVIRIQLPYKDSTTSSNQYIWLENHKIGFNDKLDFLQYSNDADCRPTGKAGIYAYYQIGRDNLTGKHNEVWDINDRDNLKPIPAEGYYDYSIVPDSFYLQCIAYKNAEYILERGAANPLNGAHDQMLFLFPDERDTILQTTDERTMWRKNISGTIQNNIPFLGDNLDAFSSHTILNMGTNPSTCNTVTCHSNNSGKVISAQNSHKDTRTVYLSGLRIEMVPLPDMDFLVHIRWDDYDITNDARWTGRIVLSEKAKLAKGQTITLAQNGTVSQPVRDPETGFFAERTQLTCMPGSTFILEEGAQLRLTEHSTLILKAGCRFILRDRARLQLRRGCTLVMEEGATLELEGKSKLKIPKKAIVLHQ